MVNNWNNTYFFVSNDKIENYREIFCQFFFLYRVYTKNLKINDKKESGSN